MTNPYPIIHEQETYTTCNTPEQAYYIEQELRKCNWDKTELPRILNEYPKWYTWLLYFYHHISKVKDKGVWTGKWKVVIPERYCDRYMEHIRYTNLEDALFERDYLVEHDWNYEALVYEINDEENPYYNMELPPYPQHRIPGIRHLKTYTNELNNLREVIVNGVTNQMEAAEVLGSNAVTVRNWLRRYKINWNDFKELCLSGEDIWNVLEFNDKIYQPVGVGK